MSAIRIGHAEATHVDGHSLPTEIREHQDEAQTVIVGGLRNGVAEAFVLAIVLQQRKEETSHG